MFGTRWQWCCGDFDRPEEALALIGKRPGQPAETELLRAHLLGDLGRLDEAAESYRALIRQRPQLFDAHETLARLLPQVGAADEALDAYREAIVREPTIDLYRSAIITARDLKNAGVMLGWTKEALARFGRQADLVALHGLALGLGGDSEGASPNSSRWRRQASRRSSPIAPITGSSLAISGRPRRTPWRRPRPIRWNRPPGLI